MTIMCYMDVS